MHNNCAFILDTETTDASFKDDTVPGLVELGVLALSHDVSSVQKLYTTESVSVFNFKPYKPIAYGAMAVHGITNGHAIGWPPQEELVVPVQPTDYIIGHNIDFDWKVLGSPDVKRICTLAMIRNLWPELDSHKLLAFVYYCAPEVASSLFSQAHGTAADVVLTGVTLRAILEKLCTKIDSWEHLWEFSEHCRVPLTIDFGKHAGMLMKDVPISYCNWLAALLDKDAYFFKALFQGRPLGQLKSFAAHPSVSPVAASVLKLLIEG